MATIRPKNYRIHRFHLFGKDLSIGGMARPDNNGADIDNALKYLVEDEKTTVLIGLKEESYAENAEKNGLEYHHLPIRDFTIAPCKTYDDLYSLIKKSTAEGKQVTVHCGAGNGRTGTALASLKLREILEQAAKKNPDILDENPDTTASVLPSMSGMAIACTPFVQQAVEELRREKVSVDESGSHSVETKGDITALINYEKHLRLIIKEEIKLQQTLTEEPDVKNIDNPVNESTRSEAEDHATAVIPLVTSLKTSVKNIHIALRKLDIKKNHDDLHAINTSKKTIQQIEYAIADIESTGTINLNSIKLIETSINKFDAEKKDAQAKGTKSVIWGWISKRLEEMWNIIIKFTTYMSEQTMSYYNRSNNMDSESSILKKPANYRETSFALTSETNVSVAGLAMLDYGRQNPTNTLNYLKNQGIQTIFGLEARAEFMRIATNLGLKYIDVTIPDFSAPDVVLYDQIYDEILAQARTGKKVAIHCFGGIGRTGTVLAAMKLKELSMLDDFFCPETAQKPSLCLNTKCTDNVRRAVLEIRKTPGNQHAIETAEQIHSLIKYEALLRERGHQLTAGHGLGA